MMRLVHKLLILLLCGSGAMATVAFGATETEPLPSFQLGNMDAQVVQSDVLRRTANWILIVVNPDVPAGHRLLEALSSRANSEQLLSSLAIVVLGSRERLSVVMGRYPTMAKAQWLSSDRAAVKALHMPGTPAILGVNERGGIAWRYTGAPATHEQTFALIDGWLIGH